MTTPVQVVLLGTMDTKGAEYDYVRRILEEVGVATTVIDVGVLGSSTIRVDVSRHDVATASGVALAALVSAGDRGSAVAKMAEGAQRVIMELHRDGRIDGALALGGTGGTAIASLAFSALPIGLPKAIVSTAASGDTRPYVGESDLVLFPSVVDIAGVNRISARILANSALAIAAMASDGARQVPSDHPLIAASMFGVTTACVDTARAALQEDAFEVVVFHMTGSGGRSMERLIRDGQVSGVLDATTTELADELVGGVFSAGADRLTAAAAAGIPQVVSLGALDMVNFGARDTVPSQFADRDFVIHNSNVTLMRTTPSECAELGRRLADRVSRSTAPASIVIPLRGVSALSIEGGPFHDSDADAALFDAVRHHVDRSRVDVVEIDAAINDPIVPETMTSLLTGYLR